MQGGFFLLSADDFPEGENDSYLNLKCRKRMPQLVGGNAILSFDYGVFSLLFLHKDRLRPADNQEPLALFLKKKS